jgi:AcrR family transcriptional regulator
MADDSGPKVGLRTEGGVIERILDSGEAVLRQNGYAGFTTRRVAEAAGIAPGNLSYHFPTKLELLRAIIARLVSRYSDRLHAAFQEPGLTPGRGLEASVRWLLEEAVNEEVVWLFRELWAMALRDEVVRDAIDDLYDELMDRIATTLQRACPDADPQSLRDLVQFIAMMSEGTTVLYGTRRERAAPYERMIDLTVRMIGVITPELASPAAGEVLP